jgi:cytochrome b
MQLSFPDRSEDAGQPRQRQVVVWDLPTRLFHWALVALVTLSFVTGKLGGNAMQIHVWSGLAILALLLFRFGWGIWGGRQARFSAFVRSPAAVIRYAAGLLRGDSPRWLGHNPMGGWSVLAMLAALLLQAGTGLFATDDIFIEGPLYPLVSRSTSSWLTRVHRINPSIIVGLVVLHVAAILFYLIVKRENLIKPMVTGTKPWDGPADTGSGNPVAAAVIAALAAAAVSLLVR